jgi:hypothetical protein
LALQLENSTNLGQAFASSSSLSMQSNSTDDVLLTPSSRSGNDSELDDFVLGSLQSKITKRAGISASSWAKIKLNMTDQGLLVCTHKRDMSEGRVIGSVEVKLTKRGVLVAQNLLLIAGLLGKTSPEQDSHLESMPQRIIQVQAPVMSVY